MAFSWIVNVCGAQGETVGRIGRALGGVCSPGENRRRPDHLMKSGH